MNQAEMVARIRLRFSIEAVPFNRFHVFCPTIDHSPIIDFEPNNINAFYQTPMAFARQLLKQIQGRKG